MRVFDVGAREGGRSESVHDRVWTIPNVLSMLRLMALPLIFHDLVSGHLVRAFWVALVFGMTDWVDGYLARRLDQVSRLGRILDPVADRALVVVVGVGFILVDIMPLWAVAVLFVRDALVIAVGLALLVRRQTPPAVTRIGKAATFGLMWALAFFLLAAIVGDGPASPDSVVRVIAWVTFAINVVLYYIAAVQYALALRRERADA